MREAKELWILFLERVDLDRSIAPPPESPALINALHSIKHFLAMKLQELSLV